MYKSIIFEVVIAIFTFILVLCACYIDCHYYRYGQLEKTNIEGVYNFVDDAGHIWEYESDEKLDTTTKIKVKMFDGYTPNNIYDDEILNFKYLF